MKNCIKPLFNAFLICMLIQVNVSAQPLIPLGKTVGVCIETKGLLVTGITEVTSISGQSVSAAYKAGIKKGDRIMAVDGNTVDDIEFLKTYLTDRTREIAFTIMRKDKIIHLMITPVQTNEGNKIGVWVRDSTAGIGTLTFYNPETGIFAGLGHGISDIDTGDIFPVKRGNILDCSISAPTKGRKGTPGELNGVFTSNSVGKIIHNSEYGIFGKGSKDVFTGEIMHSAAPSDVETGDAYILSDVDGGGIKRYTVNIIKINRNKSDGKNMILEVTDKSLIDKTGGIVQGMSGSPIIQNGKIVGAVTHVFVNDPTRGYGIFIENMLSEVEKIK